MDHQAFAQLLGNYGEFVGALAVVITLGYLAVQVRHSKEATEANTRQMRGQAFVELNESINKLWAWLRDNPERTELILRANEDWGSLNVEEQRFAMFWFGDETSYYELAFMLWQEGALDEASYVSREEYLLSMLLAPGRRVWWEDYSYLIDHRFRGRINQRLKEAEEVGMEKFNAQYPMYAQTE